MAKTVFVLFAVSIAVASCQLYNRPSNPNSQLHVRPVRPYNNDKYPPTVILPINTNKRQISGGNGGKSSRKVVFPDHQNYTQNDKHYNILPITDYYFYNVVNNAYNRKNTSSSSNSPVNDDSGGEFSKNMNQVEPGSSLRSPRILFNPAQSISLSDNSLDTSRRITQTRDIKNHQSLFGREVPSKRSGGWTNSNQQCFTCCFAYSHNIDHYQSHEIHYEHHPNHNYNGYGWGGGGRDPIVVKQCCNQGFKGCCHGNHINHQVIHGWGWPMPDIPKLHVPKYSGKSFHSGAPHFGGGWGNTGLKQMFTSVYRGIVSKLFSTFLYAKGGEYNTSFIADSCTMHNILNPSFVHDRYF